MDLYEISCVVLRHVVPEANKRRQYSVTVRQDLFGTPMVTCRWGRIGRGGQAKDHLCATVDEAQVLAARLVRQRLRRGYQTATEQGTWPAAKATTAAAAKTAARRNKARVHATQLTLDFPASPPANRAQAVPASARAAKSALCAVDPRFLRRRDGFREERVSAAEARERVVARATGPCMGASTPPRAAPTTLSPRPWNKPQTPAGKQRALNQLFVAVAQRGMPLVGRADEMARQGLLRGPRAH